MTGFDHPERAPRLLSAVTVVLTAAAGAIDVVTYFAFNQVFASTMTGNLVLLGLGLGQGDVLQVVDNVCAIAGYCAGLMLGTVFCGLMMRRYPWRNAVGATLTLELAVLVLVGVFWYAADDDPGSGKVVVLVIGAGLAMGTQAAAARYIGPSGTPTSFLSGTVTNWVSGLVELHKPFSWNWNSPLRIGVVVVAAAGNAVVQRLAPDWSFLAPVLLVVVAIALMARVVHANHQGLFAGEAQFAPDPREAVPASAGPADGEIDGETGGDVDGSGRVGEVGDVRGRVIDAHGTSSPAAVTLVDMTGRQVHRVHTAPDGRYRLRPPEAGRFVLLANPHRMGGGGPGPRAVLVSVDGRTVVHDVVVE